MRSEYGSDAVVEMLNSFGIEYVAFNPGASFRGLHESLVTAGDQGPALIEVQHEKIAIGIAHGYAKATGRPMAVVTHDLVGLLHAATGIYYAYTDRVPMLILGGAGPLDAARRRPWIDWVHSANIQNTAVRDFTKWDDYPASHRALVESLARAQGIALAEPAGPVYIAVDSELQEDRLPADWAPLPSVPPTTRLGVESSVLEGIATRLLAARRPMLVLGTVGRDRRMWDVLVDLAETVGAGIVDTGHRANFPTAHPLNQTGTASLFEADLVVLLDVKDVGEHTTLLTKRDRGGRLRLGEGATLIDIGFGDIGISSWSSDYGSWYEPDERIVADTSAVLPDLLAACRRRLGEDGSADPRNVEWVHTLTERHTSARASWARTAETADPRGGITSAQLVATVGAVLEGHDWVLTAGTGDGWAPKLWSFDTPDRAPGRSLGTATQIGISLGVALAHKGTGRLVVDLQPDGDLLFDAGARWVASRYRIPLLVIMVNNRAYNNDWLHQLDMARLRETPEQNAEIGITIDDPPVDFAAVAQSFGWQSWGPIVEPDDLHAAVTAAAEVVATTGRPALVDVVVWPAR